MTEINQERLSRVTVLARGAHPVNDGAAMCAMEAAAWIAGEEWSDHPQCVCPVIGEFMRSWNDSLPNDTRTALLLPLIPATVGTRGSDALATRRASMATDWFIRVSTPAWLRLAGLSAQADLLASMPEITDFAKAPSLLPTLTAIRSEAAAAGNAARVAAMVSNLAAWAASSRVAALDVVGVAAWTATKDAARAAARDALASTVAELQASAVDLVQRMCALTDAEGCAND